MANHCIQNESQFSEDPICFDEACEFLGVSRSFLYKATSKNVIKHYKPGKRIYFRKSELREYVYNNPVGTTKELERIAADYSMNNIGVL